MPVVTADLPSPYDVDPLADQATGAARSKIRAAIDSSPGGYLSDDASIATSPDLAAELKEIGVSLALGSLTRGRGGIGHKIRTDEARAQLALMKIASGERTLSLPRAAASTTSSRSVSMAGSTESELPGLMDAWSGRGVGF